MAVLAVRRVVVVGMFTIFMVLLALLVEGDTTVAKTRVVRILPTSPLICCPGSRDRLPF